MVDSAGNFIRLDPNSDQPIQLRDKAGNAIFTDREKGQVCLVAAKESVAVVPRENKTVQGLKSSDVRGDEQKKIQGNKKTDIVGDLATGILGNIAANVGGAVQLVITNATGTTKIPIPTDDALDIVVPTGSIRVNSKIAGSILIDALIGDVELSTGTGDADLLTIVGNATVGNALASTKHDIAGGITSSATLINSIDGSLIQLGGLAALNPLPKTLTLMPAMLAATQALGIAGTTAATTIASLPIPNPITNMIAIATIAAALTAYGAAMIPILTPGNPAFYSIKAFNA
jgi:hypothetical protein